MLNLRVCEQNMKMIMIIIRFRGLFSTVNGYVSPCLCNTMGKNPMPRKNHWPWAGHEYPSCYKILGNWTLVVRLEPWQLDSNLGRETWTLTGRLEPRQWDSNPGIETLTRQWDSNPGSETLKHGSKTQTLAVRNLIHWDQIETDVFLIG